MGWQDIYKNAYWEYDNNPPDPGGAQTALWATGTDGIRTTTRGEEVYMNCRHKILHATQESVPIEISKTYWDARPMSNLWAQFGYPSVAYSLRSLSSDQTNIIRVRRSSDNAEKDFTALQVSNGTLEAFCGVGDGHVSIWYDQSGNGYDARELASQYQPLIVENGSIVTDTDNKVAIKGTDARLWLGHLPTEDESPREMLSADGTHSLFIVCDLPDQTTSNAWYNYISRFHSTTPTYDYKKPRVYLEKTTGNLRFHTENNQSNIIVNSNDAQSAQLVTDIFNPSGTTKAEIHSVYIDGAFYAEHPNDSIPSTDGNTTLHWNSRLFSIGETTVDTYISELIYYPSDQSSNRTAIEADINNHYNIY